MSYNTSLAAEGPQRATKMFVFMLDGTMAVGVDATHLLLDP